jgi:hypothetical protein
MSISNCRDCSHCKHYKKAPSGYSGCESWDCSFEPKQTASEILKEISDELERIMYEHGGVDLYEMGITVGLSMARVAISNRRLDLEGIPR